MVVFQGAQEILVAACCAHFINYGINIGFWRWLCNGTVYLHVVLIPNA